VREGVQPPDGDDGASSRGCRQRRPLGLPLAETGEELRDVRLARVAEAVPSERGEQVDVPGEVPPVRRQRVRGQPPLDREVVEVGA
jgi:hypothetical protein